MGKTYEKDGCLYEESNVPFISDTKIGEIKDSWTGEYVVDQRIGGEVCDVDRNPFSGELNVTIHRDYWNNEESGVTITSNPFADHGQDSEAWSRHIWEVDGNQTQATSKSFEQTALNDNIATNTGYISESCHNYNQSHNHSDYNYSSNNIEKASNKTNKISNNNQLNTKANEREENRNSVSAFKIIIVVLFCIFILFPIYYGKKMDKLTEDVKNGNKFKLFMLYLIMLPVLIFTFYIELQKPIEESDIWQ